jgi:hypothetical protein
MSPRLFREWRTGWRLRRGALTYVTGLGQEPDEDDVRWLAMVATSGDADRARWELRYARQALGLLVAERDALDDRTGSLVARELTEALQSDRRIAVGLVKVAERQFNERLALYRGVLSTKSATEGTGARLGRALVSVAGGGASAADDVVGRAGELLARYLGASNEALRRTFGAAALPEDHPASGLSGGARPPA